MTVCTYIVKSQRQTLLSVRARSPSAFLLLLRPRHKYYSLFTNKANSYPFSVEIEQINLPNSICLSLSLFFVRRFVHLPAEQNNAKSARRFADSNCCAFMHIFIALDGIHLVFAVRSAIRFHMDELRRRIFVPLFSVSFIDFQFE